jgi:hypothetical protein
MSMWSLTKSELTDRIKTLIRRLSGNPTITYLEAKVISDSINQAALDLAMELGVSRWRILNRHITTTTTTATQYADLSGNVIKVVQDTVRIETENIILLPATLEVVLQYNGDGSNTGVPVYYALDVNPSDPTVTRIQFAPVPDSIYTVDMMVSLLPDADDIDTYPAWFYPTLMDKAMANSLRNLGHLNEAMGFDDSYRRRKRQLRELELPDGPIVISRPNRARSSGLESRIP